MALRIYPDAYAGGTPPKPLFSIEPTWQKPTPPTFDSLNLYTQKGPLARRAKIQEFNPCHDGKSGQFAGKEDGRCSPSSKSARMAVVRIIRQERKSKKVLLTPMSKAVQSVRGADQPYPAFLQPDITRAKRDERTTVTDRAAWASDIGAAANQHLRYISLPHTSDHAGFDSKPGTLSVLRHEIGHIETRPLASTAVVAGLTADHLAQMAGKGGAGKITEEIRAWRNAIVAGKGLVHWPTLEKNLGTYFEHGYGNNAAARGQEAYATKGAAARDLGVVVNTLRRYAHAIRTRTR